MIVEVSPMSPEVTSALVHAANENLGPVHEKEEWLVCAEAGHPLNRRCFVDLGEAKLAIEKAFPGDENDWDEQATPGSSRNMWQWYKRGGEEFAVIAEILPK
jgi:hypothetical protein